MKLFFEAVGFIILCMAIAQLCSMMLFLGLGAASKVQGKKVVDWVKKVWKRF